MQFNLNKCEHKVQPRGRDTQRSRKREGERKAERQEKIERMGAEANEGIIIIIAVMARMKTLGQEKKSKK